MVKLLLRVGLRVNSVTKLGRSPLHEAVEKGHFEVVRYLVNTAGADVLLKDHNGKTARQLAQNAKEIGKFLHAIEIIRAAENGATSISLGNLGLEIFPSQVHFFLLHHSRYLDERKKFTFIYLLFPFPHYSPALVPLQPPNYRPSKQQNSNNPPWHHLPLPPHHPKIGWQSLATHPKESD